MAVELELVERIEREPSGKFQLVKSRLERQDPDVPLR
jgi:hypothetical protein